MTSRDWGWGVVPPGFKKVVDGRGGVMIVREDVEEFLTIEECTKATFYEGEPASVSRERKTEGSGASQW